MGLREFLAKPKLKNELLSAEPVSADFVRKLRDDLRDADIIRFVVAYVSEDALNGIGIHELLRTLTHPKSFGVSSLTCRFGYKPLVALQQALPKQCVPRLKYFMEAGDDEYLRLMHEKLVYLGQPRKGRSVVYIGSHNWTAAALGLITPGSI